jgi:bifunctional oligoribonuclease and PAP phosphatase NrnA
METDIIEATGERLAAGHHILVVSHVRPDGDAVGALLGLGLALESAEKHVQMYLADSVPASLRHLEGTSRIVSKLEPGYDTFVTVDCADFKRVGKTVAALPPPDVNIDHHKTNELFGTLNLVEGEEVATSSILTKYLPRWGYHITQPIAAALLTGIITDTLGFRTSNVTPEALRQVATLMETGVDMPELYMRGLVHRSFAAARYWGSGLSRLERQDGMVITALTLEDRKTAAYGGNDDADLINVVSAIDGFKVAVLFVEQHHNRVKVSWRALQTGVDVASIAVKFGGGGHAAAAGADVEGTLVEVRRDVLRTTKQMLRL